ncbi:cell division protein FtsQ/DivIB [Lacticaseibacillus daqingensis]|uniref:cell division protein FtsQ/DivIB n=1 Tax=Lacticaseibacillus daqingensis TaxID=2486014 RepID=UPI000F77D8D7|nr:cell division protein FtsQ/DivIB [Lacticaseibacillus daqingensis]
MAWFQLGRKKAAETDPLTPWEAYQAKQAHRTRARPKLPLPQVTTLRRHHRTRNLVLVLTPLLLLLGFFGYMVSPLSKVGEITVTGTQNLPIQTVIDASQLGPTDTVIGVATHRAALASQIKAAVPEVAAVNLHLTHLNRLTIKVQEFVPMGYVVKQGAYHMILENGAIMRASSKTPADNFPVFTGFNNAAAAKMAKAIRQFPAAVRRTISEVRSTRGGSNPYQITLIMTDGNTVIADSRTVAEKISYYPAIVAQVQAKGTVDLEVGAFFTPYSK